MPEWARVSCSAPPATRVVDVRVSNTCKRDNKRADCGQRTGHAHTTRHDTSDMAQIRGDGLRTF